MRLTSPPVSSTVFKALNVYVFPSSSFICGQGQYRGPKMRARDSLYLSFLFLFSQSDNTTSLHPFRSSKKRVLSSDAKFRSYINAVTSKSRSKLLISTLGDPTEAKTPSTSRYLE